MISVTIKRGVKIGVKLKNVCYYNGYPEKWADDLGKKLVLDCTDTMSNYTSLDKVN
jgi:hypothetical protein